ncbi:MAG TPA: tetratricopeptide repeat protein, partial [Spirochaetota bacterium]|nr:tetratricopeptide repeat protein [Spirochaetota bacterium]HSA14321.1 tetratricopeptide repeat protein [Spirochaetota bacterium]
MKKIFACALILCSTLLPACKKSGADLLSDETARAASAELNRKISSLREKLGQAENDFERAGILTEIAGIEAEKGDFPACRKSSGEAVKYQPNIPRSHYLLGASYLAAGRDDEAVSELIVSIGLDPGFAPSHFELGNAYYRKKSYAQALSEYDRAAALDPDLYMAHNNSGVIKSLMGDHSGAIKSFEAAVRSKPDFARPYKNMGIIYDIHLKDPASAIPQYKKYLELRPNGEDRRLVKSWIEALGG